MRTSMWAALLAAAVSLTGVAGCGAHRGASPPPAPVGAVPAAAVSGSAAPAAQPSPGATDANADSGLNTVDQQLAGIDSELAKAAQSPSDGG